MKSLAASSEDQREEWSSAETSTGAINATKLNPSKAHYSKYRGHLK